MVKRKRILLALVVLVVLSSTMTVAWIFQNDNVRWRVRVATLKLTGRVPELAWSELLTMMRQRGGYGLEGLLEGKSVHVTLRNPYITETDIVRGGELFNSRCAGCHGATGEGGTGPRLTGGSFK